MNDGSANTKRSLSCSATEVSTASVELRTSNRFGAKLRRLTTSRPAASSSAWTSSSDRPGSSWTFSSPVAMPTDPSSRWMTVPTCSTSGRDSLAATADLTS